jgi:hypothetical protein
MQHIHITTMMHAPRRADPRLIKTLATYNTQLAYALSGTVAIALGFFAAFQVGA